MSIHLPIDTADSGADTPDRSVRHRPTRAEIDTGALQRNVARFVARTDAHVCAVVKADGYGHGALLVARAALAGGASWLAVALVEEAAELRAAGIDAPILLLSEPPTSAVDAVLDLDLTPTVYRPEFIGALDRAAAERGVVARVHVKLDTGMARVGVPAEEWDPVLALLAGAAALDVEGYQTHLARADEPGSPTTDEQLVRFRAGLAQVVAHGLVPRLLHVANSAGILMHPASWQAALTQLLPSAQVLVRPGIAVYGLSPGDEVLASDHGFEPALRLVSAVSQVRRLAAGTPVSYGHRWAAPADGWLATVPIGYADGVPRLLTGKAHVLIGGRRHPVAGTITMDQLMVWCADAPPEVGDEVVLLGAQHGPDGSARIPVEEWAHAIGTITYEIVCGLGPRVPRVVVEASTAAGAGGAVTGGAGGAAGGD